MDRRLFLAGATASLTAPGLAFGYDNTIPNEKQLPEGYGPKIVPFKGAAGPYEIHVIPDLYSLYFTQPGRMAIRYYVGVGKDNLYEDGLFYVGAKKKWPSWTPTPEMIERDPKAYKQFEEGMPGGPKNPLGARALYLFYPGRGPRPPKPDVHLSDRAWISGTAGWGGDPRKDRSIEDRPLRIGGETFEKGIGTHAESTLVYRIDMDDHRFVAIAGLDDEVGHRGVCSVRFEVAVDGEVVASSVEMRGMERWHFDVALEEGARELRLRVLEAQDGINSDHADWVDAGFVLR